MAKRSFYVKDSELDDYQVKVINKRTDNSYIVKGCAGSGKSILALWKAKQIQEQGKGSYLYVVYTKALKRYMSDGIKQIGLRESNVANFDACFMWGRGDDGILTRGSWKKGSYDYIIVDEAQDFSEEDILLLKSKTQKALLIYGDTAQQLYKFLKDKKTVSMEDIQYLRSSLLNNLFLIIVFLRKLQELLNTLILIMMIWRIDVQKKVRKSLKFFSIILNVSNLQQLLNL